MLNESAKEMISNEVEESNLTISVIGCGYLVRFTQPAWQASGIAS